MPAKPRLQRSRLDDSRASALLQAAFVNTLSAMVKRRQLSASDALEAERNAARIPVRLMNVDVHRSLELALGQNIYAHDGYFLHCAHKLSAPLLTLDQRMQQVAANLDIRMLESLS